jgi:hypothetical protein
MNEITVMVKEGKYDYREVAYFNYLMTRKERKEAEEKIRLLYPKEDIYFFKIVKIFQRGMWA